MVETEQNGVCDEQEIIRDIAKSSEEIKREIGKVIVGQERVVNLLLIALFCKGHCLFVGVPGLAKTLLIKALSSILDLKFNRIQFTPDLMPADIIGTDILEEDSATGKRVFRFIKGPIFGNLLLADEINRTPPKTQAALLQAMQEYKVTAGGKTYPLDLPFLVFATQNPIEHEGTYSLPEAQLDRFMFQINVDYPSQEEEIEIVKSTTSTYLPQLEKMFTPEKIIHFQNMVLKVPVSDHVIKYAVNLVRSTRPNENESPEFVKKWVQWGAGPRASQHLILGGKAWAILNGRFAVSCEDIKDLAVPVLQHRMITNFHAEAEDKSTLQIIDQLCDEVKEFN